MPAVELRDRSRDLGALRAFTGTTPGRFFDHEDNRMSELIIG